MSSYPGGFGDSKLGANYGPTLDYYDKIVKEGHQQVLWLVDDM
jgi:branched-chain amino acid aminotransferase